MYRAARPHDLLKGAFAQRLNRFLTVCALHDGREVRAHLPSSGRLRELLIPGAPVWLQDHGPAPQRATRYTLLAAERMGHPVLLHTHRNNDVARHLIETGAVRGMKQARIRRAEATCGNSRFDFLLQQRGRDVYAEVKSVTLFANRIAMFPDAPTERGVKHLRELSDIARNGGAPGHVLFIVHHPDVDWFMPDYHTDPAFARAMLETRPRVRFHAIAVRWNHDLSLAATPRELRIPWRHIRREAADSGAYLLLLRIDRPRTVRVGALGDIRFRAGWHVYVGSATRGLEARIARHLRRRKRMRWHIDYLRDAADSARALPIRSSRRDECDLAEALTNVLSPGPVGFGCSDCQCPTHLFASDTDPQELDTFQRLLLDFRLRAPR